MKTGWVAFELPGYREHPAPTTYTLFPYAELPPIQVKPGEGFRWLESESVKKGSLAEGAYSDGSKPDLGKLSDIVKSLDVAPPPAFMTFINSVDLHRKVRSCTDCYLDVADRAVKTRGSEDGYLIHFLSDSQWCCHWYLHVDRSGGHSVVVSFDPYGFDVGDAEDEAYATCRKAEIELEHEEIWLCSPTFTEFVYRFWLENEIWFALTGEGEALTEEQKAYVGHYKKLNAQ